jgi:hypothetical protein
MKAVMPLKKRLAIGCLLAVPHIGVMNLTVLDDDVVGEVE